MNRKSIDDREVESEASWDGPGRFTLYLGNDQHEVRVRSGAAGRHHLVIDGVSGTVFTARDDSGTWVWSRGRARLVREIRARPRGGHPSPGQDDHASVSPPMPAVVTDVLVEVGQAVKKGQDLVVVSAMKMETRLVAGYAGVVTSINTEVGANVMPGDVLIEVRPEGEDADE